MSQRLALDELHRQILFAVVLPDVVDPGNVATGDAAGEADLDS